MQNKDIKYIKVFENKNYYPYRDDISKADWVEFIDSNDNFVMIDRCGNIGIVNDVGIHGYSIHWVDEVEDKHLYKIEWLTNV